MNLFGYLEDAHLSVPVEALWEALDKPRQSKALRMLITGELEAEGRLLNTDSRSCSSTPFEGREKLGREVWEDASPAGWPESIEADKKLQLSNKYSEHIYVELTILNSPALRDLAEYERLLGTIEEFDEIFMRQMRGKIGIKLFAFAAAALASNEVNATAKSLTTHLLKDESLWPNGTLDPRNLQRHLAPLVEQYNLLTRTR